MKYRQVDTNRNDNLELPDGRLASSLRVGPLFSALHRLGVDVSVSMAKNDLLDLYSNHLIRIADELRAAHVKRIIPLPQELMREAAAFLLEKRAAL